MRFLLGLGWFGLSLAMAAPSLIERQQQTTEQLHQIKQQSQASRQQLQLDQKRYDRVANQLEQIERQILQTEKQLKLLQQQQQGLKNELSQLQQQKRGAEQQLQQQRQQLALMLRSSFISSGDSELKLVLNQHDFPAITRMQVYQNYLTQARAQLITQVEQQQQGLVLVQQKVSQRADALAQLQQQQRQKLAQLEQNQNERKKLVLAAKQQLKQSNLQLQQLGERSNGLQRLLAQLEQTRQEQLKQEQLKQEQARQEQLKQEQARQEQLKQEQLKQEQVRQEQLEQEQLKQAQTRQKQQQPAAQLADIKPAVASTKARTSQAAPIERQANYAWPVAGKPQRQQNGVFIAADSGFVVHSVTSGRVIFADWLKGFGLLLIVDHGDGLMSLYGHNQQLSLNVGDTVSAGQGVALVGNTGGLSESGVYFEIRHLGVAEDPFLWCR